MPILPVDTFLGKLDIQKVLEFFDFPRLFTCKSNTGQSYVALSTFDDGDEFHWLYLPVSSLRLGAIFKGGVSLHNAFRNPESGYLISVKTYLDEAADVKYLFAEQVIDNDLPGSGYTVSIDADVEEDELTFAPRQIAESTHREIFNYHIYPNDPRAHEIPSRKLGGILTTTQELIDALGQAASGQPSVRGPLPGELLQRTKINVAHVFRGSFGVQFRAAQFSDLFNDSTVSAAIAEFTDLLLAADSEDLLSNKLHHLRGRVASKYRRLLKELTDIDSGLLLDWGSVQASRGGQYSLTGEQVKRAYTIVDRIDIEMADEVIVSGQLVGFNSRTQRYEIRATENAKTFSGKVAADAQIEVQNPAIGEFYYAHLRMLVETQSTSGDELIRWVLVRLRERATMQP